MHTLTIASDERTAFSLSNYYRLREVPRGAFCDQELEAERAKLDREYDYAAAYKAESILLASRPDRIIIGGDYLRWPFLSPGRLADLWIVIRTYRDMYGTRVVFA